MKKTILTLVMVLTMALNITAGPVAKATPASKPSVEFKGDTITVTDGDKSVTLSGLPEMKKVRDKVNRALDDTLNAGSGTTVEIGDHRGDLSPDDVKEISNQWASVVKQMTISGSICQLINVFIDPINISVDIIRCHYCLPSSFSFSIAFLRSH